MKYLLIAIFIFMVNVFILKAQNPLSQQTQVEVGVGFTIPFLQSGKELLQARDLRDKGQSYFADANGNRKDVGTYPNNSGFSVGLAFYKPIKWAKGFMLGSVVRNSQTGSQPSSGGYAEGYYFNFISAGVALKYYPFEKNNLFLKADFGMAAVLTKNRYLNDKNEQNFFHQFGIGSAGSFELGYSFTPFKEKSKAVELHVTYQQFSTRVEVNGVGDDQWAFGALHMGIKTIL